MSQERLSKATIEVREHLVNAILTAETEAEQRAQEASLARRFANLLEFCNELIKTFPNAGKATLYPTGSAPIAVSTDEHRGREIASILQVLPERESGMPIAVHSFDAIRVPESLSIRQSAGLVCIGQPTSHDGMFWGIERPHQLQKLVKPQEVEDTETTQTRLAEFEFTALTIVQALQTPGLNCTPDNTPLLIPTSIGHAKCLPQPSTFGAA